MTRSNDSASSVAARWITIVSLGAMLLGAVLAILSIGFDWEGFLGGMALGTGVGLLIFGAYFWGYANGIRRGGAHATWLPSRDAE